MSKPANQQIPALKEVEAALADASSDKRMKMLLGLTDLFMTGQENFSGTQIKLFDDLLMSVTRQIEQKALVELSVRLAPQAKAPPNTLRSLAAHDSIGIAGPVLINSKQLTDKDLVEIARSKSQAHLTMIARRERINEAVTEALVDHGDADVLYEVARNEGARFSEAGMGKLVLCADQDDRLTETVFARRDVPAPLMRQLVAQATETVRAKLTKVARPDQRSVIEQVLAGISNRLETAPRPNYSWAQQEVASLGRDLNLAKAKLYEFASTSRIPETAAILSLVADIDIESIAPLIENSNTLALVVLCKSVGLPWRTARAVLALCNMGPNPPPHAKERHYEDMSVEAAQRIIHFWHGRQTARRRFATAAKGA